MAIETDDDRVGFFDLDDFGVSVIWRHDGQPKGTFDAILDRPSVSVEGSAEVALVDRAARLTLAGACLPEGAAAGDTVEIAGEATGFAVCAIRPDGAGLCIVDLVRATPGGAGPSAAGSVESATDRAVFCDLDEFGVPVIWARHGEVKASFTAIFNRPSVSVVGLADAALLDRGPTLYLPEAGLPEGAAPDDPVQIAGEPTGFVCSAIRPDGTGMCLVELKRAKLDVEGFHYVDGESPAELFEAFESIGALVSGGLWAG
ncbi:head-tail joining protein [Reyranella sp.]|uniref:head-tail joining protein n=1 Tax=Reyranella sp. TaxID=1929291 RepID=UPI003BAD40F2